MDFEEIQLDDAVLILELVDQFDKELMEAEFAGLWDWLDAQSEKQESTNSCLQV
ncbi:MAG: hypothetical protein V3T17_08015 [Pseudomonadales bacterium]